MNKDKIIQVGSIIVILACILIAGYVLIGGGKQTTDQTQTSADGLAPIVDGKQVIKTTVHSSKYDPNYFKVKVGVPVRFEVTSSGEPGCDAGAMVSQLFTDGSLFLSTNPGQVAVKEFTPQTAGTFGFSCTMGMIRGKIEVVN